MLIGSRSSCVTARGRVEAIRALRIPADSREHCSLLFLAPSAVALSDALGGGLLDDAYYGAVGPDCYCLYLDEERLTKRLELNHRAAVMAARLGWENRSTCLAGDALLVGADSRRNDVDVPASVITAAWRGGLIEQPEEPTDLSAPRSLQAFDAPAHR